MKHNLKKLPGPGGDACSGILYDSKHMARRYLLIALCMLLAGCGPAPLRGSAGLKKFAGTFFGVLPCPDCSGVETRLQVTPSEGAVPCSYVLSERYLGVSSGYSSYEQKGRYALEESAQALALQPDDSHQVRWFARNDDKSIEELDLQMQRVDSDAANLLAKIE